MSFLKFLWSSSPATAATPVVGSVDPLTHHRSSSESDESFVLVDAPSSSSASSSSPSIVSPVLVRATSSSSAAEEMPAPFTSPSVLATSSARSCRLYGAAHKPPRIIPSTSINESVASNSSWISSGTSSKRTFASFAELIKSTPNKTNSTRIAYAQDAKLTIAEQLLAKIEQLESLKQMSVADPNVPEDDVDVALASLDYSSPPLRPTVRLTREQSRLYDEQTSWTLNVDEPNSKRTKRQSTEVEIVLSKAERQMVNKAGKKGKSKAAARIETKAMERARLSKAAVEL